MAPHYNPVANDDIELLTPGDRPEHQRHMRTGSNSSFVHFRAPQREEELKVTHGNHLASQAFPSLLICVIGLIFAGWMMDIYQHWEVFTKVSELFILVPVLLNLKGNLEMNLAARFSTSANLGDLDNPTTRNGLVWGNLALIQVQALISGCIAGVFSVLLGIMQHPNEITTVSEIILVVASSMVSASVSSFVLGVFMCVLIIVSRMLRIDPDNIACPMASSLGDVVTLGILAECAKILLNRIDTHFSTFLMLAMFGSIPFFALLVWRNPHVKDLLFSGWTPIIVAMLISSGAGLVLERFVEQYKGLAMLTPILCGLSGNFGSIYASRISTCLHKGVQEQFKTVEMTLLLMNVPIQMLFLFIIWMLDIGHLDFTLAFAISYFIVSMISTLLALRMGKSMTLILWKYKYDPDNYVLPYLTAIIDVICTSLLVLSFTWINSNGYAELEATQ
ncbi:MgtE-domain-containing protein [Backusella circina FSU 941]|nr:MgtE-domain-containing protein [Backusella circina FSU 941]